MKKQNNTKPKIAYLISHGHSARGTFQTGLLEKLIAQGFEIIVIARKVLEADLKDKVKQLGADIDYYSPPKGRIYNQMNIFRTYVHQDIRKNPTLWEKYQRKSVDKKASFIRKLANRSYFMIAGIIRKNKFLLKRFKAFENKLLNDLHAENILKKHRPDMVISTRPMAPQEYFILSAAERLNIKKVFYILSWDNITSKGAFPVLGDHYLTWGQIMNEELAEYYNVKKENIFTTGVTHFDIHHQVKTNPDLKKWMEPLGLNVQKPYIFFTLSSSYYCPDEIEIIEWLAKNIESGSYGKDMQLVLRPHMHNFKEGLSDETWKNRLMSLQSAKVGIDFPDMNNSLLTWFMKQDDMYKLSNLLNGASINLNSGSTIALEAAMLDKPVILPLFETHELPGWLSVKRLKNYIHLKKLIDLNGVEVVDSFDALDNAIKKYINNPDLGSKERAHAVIQECFKNDGRSTERFVDHINKITKNYLDK